MRILVTGVALLVIERGRFSHLVPLRLLMEIYIFVPIRVPVPISVPVTVSLFTLNIPNAVPFF